MAQPPAYSPADFTAKEWNENRLADLDSEWAKLKAFADVVRKNLAILQRDDTKLANRVVHKDALAEETLALFATAWNPRGEWATATDYEALDAVNEGDNTYICVTAHTSGTFATDLSNELWLFVAATQSYSTDAEIETAYGNQVPVATKSDAQDPSDTSVYRFTPQLLIQAARSIIPAADTGTDVYEMDAGYDLATDDIFTADVDSANDTAAPTLENTGGLPSGAQSIVDVYGNARIGMLEARPHRFQWDGTNFVVLDPAALRPTTTSADPSLAFGAWRTPNADRPILVSAQVDVVTDGVTNGLASVSVDESGGTAANYSFTPFFADKEGGDFFQTRTSFTFFVPAGGSYIIQNQDDPKVLNALSFVREFTL